MYSEVLDTPLPELQGLKTLKVAFHCATKDEVVIHTPRLPKQSTVGDVINDLKTKVELSHPNAELRLLEIFYHKIYKIFPLTEKIENINDQYWTLRAEEIPEEEKNLAPHDHLIHVYHFTKDTTQNQVVQNFGEPFFLVIREGEILGEVKVRIQKKLKVPDEEFSKWKFALLFLGRPEYLQDSDVVSRCFQRRNDYGAWSRYLGLEHSDNFPKRSYAANQPLEGERRQRKETTEGPSKRTVAKKPISRKKPLEGERRQRKETTEGPSKHTVAKISAPPKPIDLRAERKRIEREEREEKRRAEEMAKKSTDEGTVRVSSPPGVNVEPHSEPTSSLGKRDSGQRPEPKMKAVALHAKVSRLKQLEEIGRADELDTKRRKKPAEPWVVAFEHSDGTPIMNNKSLEDHTLGERLLAGVALQRDLVVLEDPTEGWIDMFYHMSRAAQLAYCLNHSHDMAREVAERDRKNLEKALQALSQGDSERNKLKIEIDSLKPFKEMSSSFHAENQKLKARVEELEREKEVLVEEGKAECERKVAEAEARGFERAGPYYLHQVNGMEAESRASQHKVSYLQGFSHGLDAAGVGLNDERRAVIVLPEMPEVEDEDEEPTEVEILDSAASDQDPTVTTLTVG